MTAKCPLCDLLFRTKMIMETHFEFCQILEKHRGKTYVVKRRREDDVYQLIHIDKDARMISRRPKTKMFDDPDQLMIDGGTTIYSDGSGQERWFLAYLLGTERIVEGLNPYFYAEEATDADIKDARDRMTKRFEECVLR